MNIKHFESFSDGSGINATVELRGVVFGVNYVKGEVRVHLAPYKYPPRFPKWYRTHVEKWAREQVGAMPAEWHAMHRELYGI
jgi:hypothetical protein